MYKKSYCSFIEGNKGPFSNSKSHLIHRHKEEFDKFEQNPVPVSWSIRNYCVSSTLTPGRQQQLDIGLAKKFAEDNVALNFLRRKGFRNRLAPMYFFQTRILCVERFFMIRFLIAKYSRRLNPNASENEKFSVELTQQRNRNKSL